MCGLLLTCCLMIANAQAIQVDTVWTKSYAFGSYSQANSVVETFDDGYSCAGDIRYGSSDGCFVMKLDSTGDTLWTRVITYGTYNTTAHAITQSADSSFIVTGQATWDTMFIAKYSDQGDSLWTRYYPGRPAKSIVEMANGDLVVAGTLVSSDSRMFAMKTNSSGDTLWKKFYEYPEIGQSENMTVSLKQIASGGFAILGEGGLVYGPTDFAVLQRISDNGDSLWQTEYWPTWTISPVEFAPTPDGGFMLSVTNFTESYQSTPMIIRTDSLGSELWNRTYSQWTFSEAGHILAETDSNYFVTSGSQAMRIDSAGDTLWTADLPLPGTVRSAISVSASEYVLVGGGNHAYIAKLRAAECTPDTPLPPQNVVIQPQGANAQVSWSPVVYAENGCLIEVTHYLVFYAENSEGPYLYHGYTANTSYTHAGVVAYAPSMYYTVVSSASPIPSVLRDAEPGSLTMREVESLMKTVRR